MKKLLTTLLLTIIYISTANAGDRFSDLTYDYFYGKNSNVSQDVKRVIANDRDTSPNILKILASDSDLTISSVAKENLENNL